MENSDVVFLEGEVMLSLTTCNSRPFTTCKLHIKKEGAPNIFTASSCLVMEPLLPERRKVKDNRELTKRGRRRLRGLHLKIQVRVIHITTKLLHVVSR